MLKYFYNNAIGFLDVDPEFIDLGLKYALKKHWSIDEKEKHNSSL